MKEIERIEGKLKVTDEWTGSDTVDGVLRVGNEILCVGNHSGNYSWFKRRNGKHIAIIISED